MGRRHFGLLRLCWPFRHDTRVLHEVKHWNSGIAIFDAMGRGEGGKGTVAVVGPLEGVRRGAVVAIYRVGGRRCGCGGKMGPACGLGFGGKSGNVKSGKRKAK